MLKTIVVLLMKILGSKFRFYNNWMQLFMVSSKFFSNAVSGSFKGVKWTKNVNETTFVLCNGNTCVRTEIYVVFIHSWDVWKVPLFEPQRILNDYKIDMKNLNLIKIKSMTNQKYATRKPFQTIKAKWAWYYCITSLIYYNLYRCVVFAPANAVSYFLFYFFWFQAYQSLSKAHEWYKTNALCLH